MLINQYSWQIQDKFFFFTAILILQLSYSGYTFGKKKRNFDEIDRASFGAFVKRSPDIKRNFDEIDRAGFGAFVKPFPGPSKKNFEILMKLIDLGLALLLSVLQLRGILMKLTVLGLGLS